MRVYVDNEQVCVCVFVCGYCIMCLPYMQQDAPLFQLFPELHGEVRAWLGRLDWVAMQRTCRTLHALTPGALIPCPFRCLADA